MSEQRTSNPLGEMGSNVFVRRYKDERGVWLEERQVNLGGQQGTVTYVHVNDYNEAVAERDRLRAALVRSEEWRDYYRAKWMGSNAVPQRPAPEPPEVTATILETRAADETGEKHG